MPLPAPRQHGRLSISPAARSWSPARPAASAAARARVRRARRHGGAARARRAQARSALRRDRRRRASATDDSAARSRHGIGGRLRQRGGAIRAQLGRLDGARAHGGVSRFARPDRASVVRRVAEGAARQSRRGDGVDAIDAAAACRRRRTRASCSRSTRAARIRARTGALTPQPKAGLSALASTLADEWENRAESARQCRRARTDPLAASRADASGRGSVAAAAARGAGAALPSSRSARRPKAESGVRIDAQAWLAGQPASTSLVASRATGRP